MLIEKELGCYFNNQNRIKDETMARPLRIEFSGALYHITSRGDGRYSSVSKIIKGINDSRLKT